MYLKFVLPFVLLLGACATLPGQGPNAMEIEQSESDDPVAHNFAVVDLSPAVISTIGKTPRAAIGHVFGGSGNKAANRRIGVGDKITVRIWETSPDGVFASATSKSSEFPVVVGNSGSIYIPYAGKISVIGLDADAVREPIYGNLLWQGILIAAKSQISICVSTFNTAAGMAHGAVTRRRHEILYTVKPIRMRLQISA